MTDFAALYEEHYSAAHYLARTLSPTAADDLVAEAFRAVFAKMADGFTPRHFRAYLCTAVRHRWVDHQRRDLSRRATERRYAHELDQHADPAEPPDPGERAAVARTFAMISPGYRAVLWDTVVEGRTPTELADEYGLSPDAVAAVAYRARRAFRHAWADVA